MYEVGDAKITIGMGPGWLGGFHGSIVDHVGKPGIHVKGAYPLEYTNKLEAFRLVPELQIEFDDGVHLEIAPRDPMHQSITYPDGHVERSLSPTIGIYCPEKLISASYGDDSYWLFREGFFGTIKIHEIGGDNAAE